MDHQQTANKLPSLAQAVIDDLNALARKKQDTIPVDNRFVLVFRDDPDGFGEVLCPRKKKRLGRSKMAKRMRQFKDNQALMNAAVKNCHNQLLEGVERDIAFADLSIVLESGPSVWAILTRTEQELISTIDECERRGDNSWHVGATDSINGFYSVNIYWTPGHS